MQKIVSIPRVWYGIQSDGRRCGS